MASRQQQLNSSSSFRAVPLASGDASDDSNLMNVMSLVDTDLASDPNAAHKALSLFTSEEALEFYRERCNEVGVKPNNTFMRILQTGQVSLVNFANSYFGDRGMLAVAPTLQRIPVISLDLSNSGVSFEDIGRLQEALVAHPTLTAIDMSRNALSLPSARRLLSLAIQNKRITSLVLDEATPKHILIQRQCLANANVCVYASSCIVCQKSMIHSAVLGVETHIILRLLERLGLRADTLSPGEFECIWRCLIACIDMNDGVLFLCGPDCIQGLADDLAVAISYVHAECVPNVAKQTRPKSALLNRCAADFIARVQKDPQGAALFQSFSVQGEPREADWTVCSISGEPGVRISQPQSLALRLLAKDIRTVGINNFRPSAFSRTLHLMLRYARMEPCSVKSVRMLVRFGIYGSGCALHARPRSDDVLLDSLATPLPLPPDEKDFAVVNFSTATLLDQGEHDIACACAVAALLEDIDGVAMDPYFIFAAARHISRKSGTHLGVDLRAACAAAREFGALPLSQAPFNRDTPRHIFAEWSAWKQLPNFDLLLKHAFGHRKTEVFLVTGPHDNVFDNLRTALFAYRKERRPIVATMKWRVEWMTAELGVIPQEKFNGGFHTAVKIVGQTTIDGVLYLVLQANFGRNVGNKGFFYASRPTINRNVRGGAFIFLNRRGVMEKTGMPLPPPTYFSHVGDDVAELLRMPTAVFDLLRFIGQPQNRQTIPADIQRLQRILANFPPSLVYAFVASQRMARPQERFFALATRAFYSHQSNSQVAFFWSEVLGDDAVQWALRAVQNLQVIYDARRAASEADTKQRRYLTERRGSLWIEGVDAGPNTFVLAEAAQGADADALDESAMAAGPAVAEARGAAIAARATEVSPEGGAPAPQMTKLGAGGAVRPKPPSSGPPGAGGAKKPAARKTVSKQQEEAVIEKHKRLLDIAATAHRGDHDAMLTEIEVAGRAEHERQEQQSRIFRRKTDFTWDPARIASASVTESPMYALQKRSGELPERFIGKRWTALSIPTHVGAPTKRACVFLHDSVCFYDIAAAQPSSPLVPIKGHPDFEAFPFASGFEAASFCRALHPTEAFFFCEEHWMCWDLTRNACTRGPFSIHLHCQFRNLPEDFRRKIDCVLDVSGKPQLIFISGRQYLLFDLERHAVVDGAVFSVSEGPLQMLFATVPGTPTCALYEWSKQPLTDERDHRRGSATDSTRSFVITTAGATMLFDMGAFACCESSAGSVVESPFAALPLPFLQPTTVAFNTVQAALINRLPKNKIANPQQFAPAAPPGGVVAPSVLSEGVAFSWKMSITTDFELVPSSSGRTDIEAVIEPVGADDSPALLHSLVKLQQCGAAGEPRFVLFDAGSLNSYRFGYVQLVFDLTSIDTRQLLTAPIDVVVEVSWDGVGYRPVAEVSVFDSFTDVWWPATHSARFWRLRVLDCPCGVGIIKICWFTVHWVTDSPHYALAERFIPRDAAVVRVDAAGLKMPPRALVDDIASGAVFETAPHSTTFLAKHCILPLLAPANSALLFVGDSFVEWDFAANEVVGARRLGFDTHPAFRQLPFPFSKGIDAACYADPSRSRAVLLITDGLVMEWHLEKGAPIGEAVPLLQSFWFAGLPEAAIRDGIDAVVNIWERPGQVFIFSGVSVTRWSIHAHQLVDGPLPRARFPLIHCADFDGPLLTAVSFPHKPLTSYLFCGAKYASVTWSRDRRVVSRSDPCEVSLSPEFAPVAWYLRWGVPSSSTTVLVDFVDEAPLFTGITLRSEDGCSPGTVWRVDCSADAVEWKHVSRHTQSVPKSSTMWDIEAVAVGFRYWRLTVETNDCARTVAYHHLIFHHLPDAPLHILPLRLQSNGELRGDGPVFAGGKVTFTKPSGSEPGHITADFGPDTPPEITAVSFATSGAFVSDLWGVLYSDDGQEWTEVGMWRVRSNSVKVHWAPAYPHRFWRVELRASLNATSQTAFFRDWQFHEYTGPSFVSSDRQQYLRGLASLFPTLKSSTRLHVDCVVGSCLAFDFKGDAQALCGVGIYTEVDSLTFMTSFAVEYSDDASTWYNVGSVLVCDDLGTAAWEHEGRHRFWRLRITQHYGGSILRLLRIEFFVSGPTLYTRHQRHVHKLGDGNVFADRDFVQGEFVACHAVLPPESCFVVERGTDDHNVWSPVGVLVNTSSNEKNVTCGWAPCASSLFWRLRDVSPSQLAAVEASEDGENKPTALASLDLARKTSSLAPAPTTAVVGEPLPSAAAAAPIGLPPVLAQPPSPAKPSKVTWSSFTGMRSHAPDLSHGVDVIVSGFVLASSAAAARGANLALTLSRGLLVDGAAKPILASTAESPNPRVLWVFERNANFSEIIVDLVLDGEATSTNAIGASVEISDDGERFATVAKLTIGKVGSDGSRSCSAHAFWASDSQARFWRLSFTSGAGAPPLLVAAVRWLFKYGSPSLIPPPAQLSLSNPLHSEWLLRYDGSATKQLRSAIASSFANAQSFVNGFTEESDLSETDLLVLGYIKHQKAVQKVVTRSIKEQKGGNGKVPSANVPQFVDVGRVLEMIGSPAVLELRSLIGPVTMSELKVLKETNTWWMPRAEFRGTVVQPVLGFVGCAAALSFRWFLSPDTLRNASNLRAVSHLDPLHCAALFALNVTHEGWLATANFPSAAPLMYELGIGGRPLMVCFASNRIEFNEQYPLLRPGADPFPCELPVVLHRGVNVVCELRIAQCLCAHRIGYIANFIGKRKFKTATATAVIHVPSPSSSQSFVRFSLPTAGLTFGIDGLNVPALSFELRWDGALGALSFVGCDASWTVDGVKYDALLSGQVNTDRPTVSLRCRCPEGFICDPEGLKGTVLTDLFLTAECLVADTGFAPAKVHIMGTLRVGALSFTAHLLHGTAQTAKRGLRVQLMDNTFAEIAHLCSVVTRTPLAIEPWMAERQLLTVTCSLAVSPALASAKGVGSASFNAQSGTASVTATAAALRVACEMPSARIGSVFVEGNPETGLTVDGTAPAVSATSGALPTIRVDGSSALVTASPTPCQIELSRLGTVCVTKGAFFEGVVHDETFHPVYGTPAITVPAALFEEPIRQQLLHSHIVSAIVAAAVPFTFVLRSVSVDQCSIERKTFMLTFRGVLMGSGWEVLVTSCCPDDSLLVVDAIAVDVAAVVLEQCHEALWSTYERFVGARRRRGVGGDEPASEGFGADGGPASPFAATGSSMNAAAAPLRLGTFLGAWQDQEAVELDELLANAVDTI